MNGDENQFHGVKRVRLLQRSGKLCLKMAELCLMVGLFLMVWKVPGYAAGSHGNRVGGKNPVTFEQWQTENQLSGQNGPLEDRDGDGLANLAEFVLGLPADSGLITARAILPRLVYHASSGKFDFEYQRRRDLPAHVEIRLMMLGFNGYEQATTIEPTVKASGDDLENVVYADVESDPMFQSLTQGKLRLKVSFSSATEPPSVVQTPLWCWRRQPFATGGSRSFTMPLVRQDLYRGRVAGVGASVLEIEDAQGGSEDFALTLEATESYYVELMEGPLEGQRWEVDEAACRSHEIVLDLTSPRNTCADLPDLTGMMIVVRPHQTLISVIRTDRLLAASRLAQADRVQFWDRAANRYTEYWLALRAGNVRQWVQAGDPAYADAGSHVLLPNEGLFVKLSSIAASLPLVGLCREADLVLVLDQGTSLMGTGWTDPASPEQLGMTSKQVFSASTRSKQADRFRTWNNQSGVSSIRSAFYWRASNAGHHEWVMEGDADMMGQNDASLLNAFEAFFFIHPGAATQWRQPAEQSLNDHHP